MCLTRYLLPDYCDLERIAWVNSLDHYLPLRYRLPRSTYPLYPRLQHWQSNTTAPPIIITFRSRQRSRNRKYLQYKPPRIRLLRQLPPPNPRRNRQFNSWDPRPQPIHSNKYRTSSRTKESPSWISWSSTKYWRNLPRNPRLSRSPSTSKPSPRSTSQKEPLCSPTRVGGITKRPSQGRNAI